MVLYGGGCRSGSVDYSEHGIGVSIIPGSEFCRRHGVYEWKRVTLLSLFFFFFLFFLFFAGLARCDIIAGISLRIIGGKFMVS